MARKPMTEEAKKEKAAKAAATRAANQEKALKTLGLERNKVKTRKKRKPMSPEQKAAAVERLAKARAAKQAANGDVKYKSYDESIRDIPDDDTFSVKNVLSWLKYQKDFLKSIRSYKDSKDVKERKQYTECQVYIDNLGKYLRTGVYTSSFYGRDGTHTVKYICRAMAYNKDGSPKRSEGVWYPDISTVWTKDYEDE